MAAAIIAGTRAAFVGLLVFGIFVKLRAKKPVAATRL
jgi:hypothetical protein